MDAGEDHIQLLVQGAGIPRDAGQEDEASGDDIARWDDGRIVLLHGLLGGPAHGPQVHGDGTFGVEVARGDVARAGGAGFPSEDLGALSTTAVAGRPVPAPKAGADRIVQGKTVAV